MNLTALTTLTRNFLAEPSASYFTDNEIMAWLNEGAKDLCARTRCSIVTASQLSVNATATYTLSRCLGIIAVVGQTDLISLAELEFSRIGGYVLTAGKPSFYKLINNATNGTMLLLYPTPSTVYIQTYDIWYYSYPADMTVGASTIADVPAQYHWLIALFAAIVGRLKQKDYQAATAYYRIYIDSINNGRVQWSDDIVPMAELDKLGGKQI